MLNKKYNKWNIYKADDVFEDDFAIDFTLKKVELLPVDDDDDLPL